jgi:predicted alpha/beta-fold hydrolase
MEYLYQEYCIDENGVQKRRLLGVGVSLGAQIIALYAARKGDMNRFDCCVGIGCNFCFYEMCKFVKTFCFGFYDYFIGLNLRRTMVPIFTAYDQMMEKKRPN